MKKDKKNVDYKKLTVEIPMTTFLRMERYCSNRYIPGKKDIFYCDFVNRAINDYIDSPV